MSAFGLFRQLLQSYYYINGIQYRNEQRKRQAKHDIEREQRRTEKAVEKYIVNHPDQILLLKADPIKADEFLRSFGLAWLQFDDDGSFIRIIEQPQPPQQVSVYVTIFFGLCFFGALVFIIYGIIN